MKTLADKLAITSLSCLGGAAVVLLVSYGVPLFKRTGMPFGFLMLFPALLVLSFFIGIMAIRKTRPGMAAAISTLISAILLVVTYIALSNAEF